MPGYMFAVGSCIACGRMITFNPNLVPSIRHNGSKEPLCMDCVKRWEQIHGQHINVHPDAYEPEAV